MTKNRNQKSKTGQILIEVTFGFILITFMFSLLVKSFVIFSVDIASKIRLSQYYLSEANRIYVLILEEKDDDHEDEPEDD